MLELPLNGEIVDGVASASVQGVQNEEEVDVGARLLFTSGTTSVERHLLQTISQSVGELFHPPSQLRHICSNADSGQSHGGVPCCEGEHGTMLAHRLEARDLPSVTPNSARHVTLEHLVDDVFA